MYTTECWQGINCHLTGRAVGQRDPGWTGGALGRGFRSCELGERVWC